MGKSPPWDDCEDCKRLQDEIAALIAEIRKLKSEYICTCGLRVIPHVCEDIKDELEEILKSKEDRIITILPNGTIAQCEHHPVDEKDQMNVDTLKDILLRINVVMKKENEQQEVNPTDTPPDTQQERTSLTSDSCANK